MHNIGIVIRIVHISLIRPIVLWKPKFSSQPKCLLVRKDETLPASKPEDYLLLGLSPNAPNDVSQRLLGSFIDVGSLDYKVWIYPSSFTSITLLVAVRARKLDCRDVAVRCENVKLLWRFRSKWYPN